MSPLEASLSYTFKDQGLLTEALTHTSYANENHCRHNERLEFLGDTVLNAATTQLLYRQFSTLDEGQLSALRANLVNTETLAEIAQELDMGHALRLGVGETSSGGRTKPTILADAVEAVIGALFLEAGFDEAAACVQNWMTPRIRKLADDRERQMSRWRDPRSQFQERVQAALKRVPEYRVVSKEGPPHAPVFTVEASVDGRVVSAGQGRSKREAIKRAAEQALVNPCLIEE